MNTLSIYGILYNCHVCDHMLQHACGSQTLRCHSSPSPLLETDPLSFTAVSARMACELLGIFPVSASVIMQYLGSERYARYCSWLAFT